MFAEVISKKPRKENVVAEVDQRWCKCKTNGWMSAGLCPRSCLSWELAKGGNPWRACTKNSCGFVCLVVFFLRYFQATSLNCLFWWKSVRSGSSKIQCFTSALLILIYNINTIIKSWDKWITGSLFIKMVVFFCNLHSWDTAMDLSHQTLDWWQSCHVICTCFWIPNSQKTECTAPGLRCDLLLYGVCYLLHMCSQVAICLKAAPYWTY